MSVLTNPPKTPKYNCSIRRKLAWNAVYVLTAVAGHENAVHSAVHDLRLLDELALGILPTIKQHNGLLSPDSNATGTPASAASNKD